MIKILLADDHKLMREGLRKSFESAGDVVVGEAANGEEAVRLAKALRPEVILMDLSMPVMDGIEATRNIMAEVPGSRVAVLTMHDDVEKTREAIEAGAKAYLSKGTSFTDVRETVIRVVEGDTVMSPALAGAMITTASAPNVQNILSDRQIEILQAIADGMTVKQAGRHLGITRKTVHNHLNTIYRKLDTQSMTHTILSAVRMGIIDLNPVEGQE